MEPWHLVHRVHLHEKLKHIAVSPEGGGRPVQLRTGSRVVDIDPSSGTTTLENGEVVHGDLVVGADGVHVRRDSTLLRFFN